MPEYYQIMYLQSRDNYPYKSWLSMRSRCLSLKTPSYVRYGGRGIIICARWDSFLNFLADMGERPDGFTLERIDSNGNYSPENCKWASRKEQARNTNRNRVIEYQGERKTLVEWAETKGLSRESLRQRLLKWPLEIALTRPVRIQEALSASQIHAIRVSKCRV